MCDVEENLYFAYGSNLDLEQMAQRCPDAEIVGPVRLENYELRFRGSGFATVAPKKGSTVHGLVWKLTPNCEQSLDRYEGYPHFYYKTELELPLAETGKKLTAFVYIMHEERRLGIPTSAYVSTCKFGYTIFGFDFKYLDEAYEKSLKGVANNEK